MAAYKPIDYSKWANIEVSDDDEDEDHNGSAGGPLPPNISEMMSGMMSGGSKVSQIGSRSFFSRTITAEFGVKAAFID